VRGAGRRRGGEAELLTAILRAPKEFGGSGERLSAAAGFELELRRLPIKCGGVTPPCEKMCGNRVGQPPALKWWEGSAGVGYAVD
jgi:hypothetical protein